MKKMFSLITFLKVITTASTTISSTILLLYILICIDNCLCYVIITDIEWNNELQSDWIIANEDCTVLDNSHLFVEADLESCTTNEWENF